MARMASAASPDKQTTYNSALSKANIFNELSVTVVFVIGIRPLAQESTFVAFSIYYVRGDVSSLCFQWCGLWYCVGRHCQVGGRFLSETVLFRLAVLEIRLRVVVIRVRDLLLQQMMSFWGPKDCGSVICLPGIRLYLDMSLAASRSALMLFICIGCPDSINSAVNTNKENHLCC
ncbi:hypothetical protein NPIL_60111 [Nephila pilipes]|uniref:Uncharacterized protein n=1 Tax=Nephila pilipes TaxID=299642 RepID=A0A8X6MZJ6_NEPPI|nr:hypothetical protein NPIL_60111 [Nephila pilipes]